MNRKPGRVFWITTFAVGVLSPGTGKRRIKRRMQEIHQDNETLRQDNKSLKCRNSELMSENEFLRGELRRVEGENAMFLVQDEMNLALIHDSHVADSRLPASSDDKSTNSLQVVNQPMARA